MKSKNLFLFFLALSFAAAFLGFWWFIFRKETPQREESVVSSPSPSIQQQEMNKQRALSELPYFGDGFTIEYFPSRDYFFVQITEPPYKEKEEAALNWFKERGLDTNKINIEWGSTRGVAP